MPTSIFFVLFLLVPISNSQLLSSERRILFRLQEQLEFPPALQGWSNWTSFCDLTPSSSLTITCSGNRITELTLIGNKTSSSSTPENFKVSQQTLSEDFSIDTFFTLVTKLSRLKVLSLVSLGLWGTLPWKIDRLASLQVLNVSSNCIYGEIPLQISTLVNLRSLVLANNLFKGEVPDLRGLAALEELNVGDNFLGPRFPSLGNKVVGVGLKNNKFRSQIPLEFKNFKQLRWLDVSYNNITGTIPSALFSLRSIESIDVSGNRLMGSVLKNTSCSSRLRYVDLSDNLLVGDLPLCIRYNSSSRVVLYTWNCLSTGDLEYQHPNSMCHEKALAVKPPTVQEQEQLKKRSASKVGLMLGVIGAVVGGVLVIGLLVLVILRKVRARETGANKSTSSVAGKSFNGLSPKLVTDARHVPPAMMFGALGLPQYHVFSLEEIEEATNNFDSSNLIGEGSQGQLYKGWLRDGSAAVVRCLKLKQRQSTQTLGRHIEVLSKLRHQHLVSVLGHSLATHQDHANAANTFLVFECVSDGTLRSHLTDPRKREMLKWPQRMAVAIGVARGVQFLHSGVTPGLFGNDLKTENIMLDENLKAKISNYNLPLSFMIESEIPHNGEKAAHTYTRNAEDAAKQDVYELGIILLEIITGKQITSQTQLDAQKIQLERGLADTPSELEELVDPSIRRSFAYESLRTSIELTINCLSKNSSQRPSIEDVLWNLQYSVQVQEGWMPSGESFGALRNQSF